MTVNAFVFGVIATLAAEFIIITIHAAIQARKVEKEYRKNDDDQ